MVYHGLLWYSLTLSCSANERTEMKLKIYLSEAWMCSEFGYQRPMSNKKGLMRNTLLSECVLLLLLITLICGYLSDYYKILIHNVCVTN